MKLASAGVTLNVQPYPAPVPGQPSVHYVRAGATGPMDGSYAHPWSSVDVGLAAKTGGGTPIVGDHSTFILLRGTHNAFTVNRIVNVLGESIPFTIVKSLPGKPAVRVLAGASTAMVRRLSIQPAAGPPAGRGIEVYGAEDVTISNCLFTAGRPAIELNETTGVRVQNCGFYPSSDTTVTWRYSDGAVWNNWVSSPTRGTTPCTFYAYLADNGGAARILGASSFGAAPSLCNDPNVPFVQDMNDSGVTPVFADFAYQVPDVEDTALVDQGTNCPAGVSPCPPLPDRDGSANDRGAYGGPFGETRRSEVGSLVVVPLRIPLFVLMVVLAGTVIWVRWRRRRGT